MNIERQGISRSEEKSCSVIVPSKSLTRIFCDFTANEVVSISLRRKLLTHINPHRSIPFRPLLILQRNRESVGIGHVRVGLNRIVEDARSSS